MAESIKYTAQVFQVPNDAAYPTSLLRKGSDKQKVIDRERSVNVVEHVGRSLPIAVRHYLTSNLTVVEPDK